MNGWELCFALFQWGFPGLLIDEAGNELAKLWELLPGDHRSSGNHTDLDNEHSAMKPSETFLECVAYHSTTALREDIAARA